MNGGSSPLGHPFAFFGYFPARTLGAARDWAKALNEQVEAGIDPREAQRAEQVRGGMTVARAHELYMAAVREGRASLARKAKEGADHALVRAARRRHPVPYRRSCH